MNASTLRLRSKRLEIRLSEKKQEYILSCFRYTKRTGLLLYTVRWISQSLSMTKPGNFSDVNSTISQLTAGSLEDRFHECSDAVECPTSIRRVLEGFGDRVIP